MNWKLLLLLLGSVVGLSACAGLHQPAARELVDDSIIDLSNYRQVLIEPPVIEFDKYWTPVQIGTHLDLSDAEKERVKAEISRIFEETFARTFEESGLEVVDEARPGVLRIRPKLLNVYLNAPAAQLQQGRTYARRVGQMTLDVSFVDAANDKTLVQLTDHVKGRDIGLLRPAGPVFNRVELTDLFEDWAMVIRHGLFRNVP